MAKEALPLTISGKNIQIPEPLKRHAEERLTHLLRFLRRVHSVQVVHSQERSWQLAEVTVHADGVVVRAEERAHDMRSAVDAAIDKIARQLRRYKDKVSNRPRHASSPASAEQGLAGPLEGLEPASEPRIVRTKRFTVKPMSADEAALQMEMLGHDFFVFLNAETDEVNVVYRRNDGNYGLIEPER